MKTKTIRLIVLVLFVMSVVIVRVSARSLPSSPPIEMDEGRKAIPQGERIIAPSSVNASDGDYNDQISIYWDSVPEADHYELYVSDDEYSSSPSNIYSGGGTSHNDTYATGGTYYYYWVKACDESECSDYSSSDQGYLDLDPPSNVQASDGTSTYEIEVTWDASSRSSALPVEIWRYEDDIQSSALYLDTSYGSPYSDSTVDPGKYYHYWVKACGDDFCSELSSSTDDGYMAVEAPTGVSASDGTYTDRVEVEWNLSAVSLYEVFRHTSNNSSGATSLGTEYGMSYSDDTAVPGTTYYYWVKAWGEDVSSDFSDPDSGYRLALNYHLFLPLILK